MTKNSLPEKKKQGRYLGQVRALKQCLREQREASPQWCLASTTVPAVELVLISLTLSLEVCWDMDWNYLNEGLELY